MTGVEIEQDLGYIKKLVDNSELPSLAPSVYLLWAAIIAAGFSLIDFAPKSVGFFWMIASPLGGILSGILGRRSDRAKGQIDRETGRKHAIYWTGMLGVTVLAVLLGVRGFVHGAVISQVILLVVAMGWWGAGVLFDRYFLYLGGLMMAGFIATLFTDRYVWTAIGLLLAVTLTAMAVRKGRQSAHRAD